MEDFGEKKKKESRESLQNKIKIKLIANKLESRNGDVVGLEDFDEKKKKESREILQNKIKIKSQNKIQNLNYKKN